MISLKSNNTCKLTEHIDDRMPRRRKRHFHKMSLMLLIFVGCCSTLILSPLLAQAKETNNNATSEGENMLSTDQHEGNIAVLVQGEANDKTNDKNTFKRLKPTDFNDRDGVAMAAEEEVVAERSSEVIEMIQPPHTLRHQEHYKKRILMAEKDFQQKQKQLEKQLVANANTAMDDDDEHDDDDGDYDGNDEQQERELSVHNRNLRYQQIQLALREPLASPTPSHHHRRHEHHMIKQRLVKQTAFTWPQQQQQHHLRHQHHQHQESPSQQAQLRHVKPEMRKQNISTTNAKPLHQRYFDRESSYLNTPARMMTTEGPPHLRHTGSNKYWNTLTYSANPHNRLHNDEATNNKKENKEEEQEDDIKRISLSLDEHENIDENEHSNKNKEKITLAKLDDNDNYDVSTNANANNNDDEDDPNVDDDDYDYSYEDEDDMEINKQNKYPYLPSNTKTNVKRYTNPLRPLYKPSSSLSSSSSSLSSSYAYRSNQRGNHHLRHSPHNFKSSSNDNNNDDDDDDDNDYDDMVNYEDDTAAAASSSDIQSPNDDDKFSDEKWNKIEHEHYRKQLQHQRAMQALRSRRPSNNNNPHKTTAATTTTALHNNKYLSYTPAVSLTPSSTYNAAWTKRQTINDDDGDNIYSRSYVPGTVTRKKEEELGSPTAILEARRQYALQQRQNKALASAHHRRIVTEGSCRLPQPRVERIRRDSWKIYTPHCTILHRCADDAGCCPSERQTCAPKRTKNVDLYFFVISLNETQGSIEKLTFVNHTECHCVQRSKQRAPEYGSGAKDLISNNQIPFLRRATVLNCYCPNLFEKILQEDGYCRCDCSSGNMGCDWLKRGMEHFSMNDRKCIIEGRCKLPTCEYGHYIKKHGRCPRREERHLSADVDW